MCHLSIIIVQNKIVLPTTAPVSEQRDALFRRVGEMVEAAGRSGVNVLCLQEAWSEFDPSNDCEKMQARFRVLILQRCRSPSVPARSIRGASSLRAPRTAPPPSSSLRWPRSTAWSSSAQSWYGSSSIKLLFPLSEITTYAINIAH